MARQNNSFFAILGLLGFEPMSGYDIKTCVDKGVGYFWDIDYHQIYPTLSKMVSLGYVQFEENKSGYRPMKKVYSITAQGLEALKEWLGAPISDGKQSSNELKLKLFFGHHVSVDTNVQHVRCFMQSCIDKLNEVQQIKEKVRQEDDIIDSMHYRMTTVFNGEILLKAQIEWCEKTIGYLTSHIMQK